MAARTARPVFGCGTLLTDVAQPRSDLNARGRGAHDLLVTLEPEGNPIVAGAFEDVLDREASLDFALARLVRRTVVAFLRPCVVAPVPFDRWTVELLEIV